MNRLRLLNWILGKIGMQLVPSVDHLALYRAKVVAQSGQTVDVQCDDRRVGDLAGVPIALGLPGSEVDVSAGAFVLIGWRNGDPRYPYATTWEGGATATRITIGASTVYLGAESGANFVALANLVDAELTKIATSLNTHKHTGVTTGVGTSAVSDTPYTKAGVAAAQVKAK